MFYTFYSRFNDCIKMDQDLEVHLVIRDSFNSCTPSLSRVVELFENQRKVNKENVNERDENGETLLHRVVQKPKAYSSAVVNFLLEKGAQVTMKTKNKLDERQDKTALHITTQNMTDYSLDIVKILSTNLPAVNAEDGFGKTSLYYAVGNEHESALEIVRFLLEKGADINQKSIYDRETPLHRAVENEHESALGIVHLLLEKGADINTVDNTGKTPLHLAVGNKHESAIKIVRFLLEKGADINTKDMDRKTPLQLAVNNNNNKSIPETIRLLLEKGADINTKDRCRETPLHLAVKNNNKSALEIIRLLLARGADVNATNIHGYTPLCRAVGNQLGPKIVGLFLEKGADINQKGIRDGGTPLHRAAENKNEFALETVCLLLEKGADINTKDNDGYTPSLRCWKQRGIRSRDGSLTCRKRI